MGKDFAFMNAAQNYWNIDNMIEYMNEFEGDKFFLKYSTPSQYVDALAKYDVKWPTKYDDMMPYADSPDSVWVGYYSSRMNDKEYVRKTSHTMEASAQLYAEKVLDQSIDNQTLSQILNSNYELLDELSVVQHHDAIAGTSKQKVANDYTRRLYKATQKNSDPYQKLIGDKIAE